METDENPPQKRQLSSHSRDPWRLPQLRGIPPQLFQYLDRYIFAIEERLYSPSILRSLCDIKFGGLKTLDLKNNEIVSCEAFTLFQCNSLRFLDLSNNLITSFSPLIRLKPLETCSIFNNPSFDTNYIQRCHRFEIMRVPVNSLSPIRNRIMPIGMIGFASKKETNLGTHKTTMCLVTVSEFPQI